MRCLKFLLDFLEMTIMNFIEKARSLGLPGAALW